MRSGHVALTVGAGVALVVIGASVVSPADDVDVEHPPQLEPVRNTSLVCPYTGGNIDDFDSRIGVLAIDGVTGTEGDAEPVRVVPLDTWTAEDDAEDEDSSDEKPEPLMKAPDRGVPKVSKVKVDDPTSYVIDVEGPLAAGIAAETMAYARGADRHGYSTAACTAPAREQWFVGGSGADGKRGALVLANPSRVPAIADVDVWNASGPVDAAATQDINVPPNSQRILLLDALAPEAEQVAVHVSTERGKVAAGVEIHEDSDAEAQGLSYLPPATSPSTNFVIPGVSAAGKSTLQLFNPGETDAIATIKYLGDTGPFAPADIDNAVTVPAEGILSVPLSGVDAPVAVAVETDQPVTAAVRSVRKADDGPRDVALTAAAAPLEGPAAVLLGRAEDDFATLLTVSSVSQTPSRASVQVIDDDGEVVDEQDVDVPPGATVTVDLEQADDASYPYAVIRPADDGTLVVARRVSATNDDGAFLDILPVRAPAIDVPVPEVVNELPEIPNPDDTN